MVGSDKRDKLSVFLGIPPFLLLSYPFLEIFNRNVMVAGIPLLPLFGLPIASLRSCRRARKTSIMPRSSSRRQGDWNIWSRRWWKPR